MIKWESRSVWLFSIVIMLHSSLTLSAQEYQLTRLEVNDTLSYKFKNMMPCPITIKIKTKIESLISIPKNRYVVQPNDSLLGLVYIPQSFQKEQKDFDPSNYFGITLNYGARVPNDSIKNYRYGLPFLKGKKYKIIQGFNGRFTHNSKQSRYAVDFKIPVGDTIVAARGGLVINTKDHFKEHGGKELRKKANQIVVQHDDGTLAFYVHLDYKGVMVNVGDRIEAGSPLGISGWTGYSTTPHLHFVVRNLDESIPIQFLKNRRLGKKSGKWARNY